jgi:hypothetical protein
MALSSSASLMPRPLSKTVIRLLGPSQEKSSRTSLAPAEMRAFIAADRERWAVLVRELNIRLE